MPLTSKSGVGYGGGAKGEDSKQRRQGRQQAESKETKLDRDTVEFFQSMRQRNFPPSERTKLVRLLQETFRRGLVLTDWTPRRFLFEGALTTTHALAKSNDATLQGLLVMTIDDDDQTNNNTNKVEIEETQDETIVSLLTPLAELGNCCVQKGKKADASDVALAKLILNVQALVLPIASRLRTNKNAPIVSITTPQDLYKQRLGPLRFELCPSLPHHCFPERRPSNAQIRRLFKELTSYKTALPVDYGSSIFVRAVEDRLDTLRALIVGPDETPYANGGFVFDIFLPASYPKVAPKVKFVNHGSQRFNPNLYNDGKVCLSLLGTWTGPGWVAGESTLLQVLVSIQSLILVPEPYFNEPGYERSLGTERGNKQSRDYNIKIRRFTLQHTLLPILKSLAECKPSAYPEFDEVFEKHFVQKRARILQQLEDWRAQDHSLARIVSAIQEHLEKVAPARAHTVKRRASKMSPPSYQIDDSGVIDLYSNDTGNDAKRQRPSEVVVLEEGEEDSKMPAKPASQLVDLT